MGLNIATFSVPVAVAWYVAAVDADVDVSLREGSAPVTVRVVKGDFLLKKGGAESGFGFKVKHTPHAELSSSQCTRHQGRMYALCQPDAGLTGGRALIALADGGAFQWFPIEVVYNE